ncbi:beta-galactosidase [Candidatus Izemoplasma sp. B36]|uniref:beta-galactosidase n=1 Tax=Candidatus Izemoplasma sp. B36 TaxID=3242468 RepID=UPI003556CE5E
MKKGFLNKLLVIITVLLISISFVSCGSSEPPVYEDTGLEMQIGAWVSPNIQKDSSGNYKYITLEQYQAIADSGINTIYGLYEVFDLNATMTALDLADQVGIGYYVRDPRISGLFQGVLNVQGIPDEDEVNDDYADFIDAVDDYKDHVSFKGNLIYDEPGGSLYDWLGLYNEKYSTYLPDKDFYVNLLPTYASLAQRDELNYEQYLRQYIETVNPAFVSYDHYPLMVFYEEPVLTDDFLYNLEIVSTIAHEYDLPFWTFIQTIGFTVPSGTQHRVPTEADLRWQVALSMAYGAQGIQHFCYWTPGTGTNESFDNAMIDREGNKTPLYFAAQTVNQEVLSYDEVYLQFDWQGVLTHSNESFEVVNFRMLQNRLESHARIESITSEEDVVIGTFTGPNNEDAFMVVNFNDPALGLSNKVQIDFNDAKQAIVYIKGVRTIVDLDKGVLDIELESGEGIFVIPFK